MCGIAGVIHRDGASDIGTEMTAMLNSIKDRGPVLTGLPLFGPRPDLLVIRFKLADANDKRDTDFKDRLDRRRREVGNRLKRIGATVELADSDTEYAYRVSVNYDGDLKTLTDMLEEVP